MIGGKALVDQVEIVLGNRGGHDHRSIWIDVWDNSLARRWLAALNDVLDRKLLLQKNYCFVGFADSPRNGEFICHEINLSIAHINGADINYHIDDFFVLEQCIDSQLQLCHDRFNRLHTYFEDLQGVSGSISQYWQAADAETRWHISQLNLLCHEFETWALSWRKKHTLPEWQRPSQLMCWNHAPRFYLQPEDYQLFGIHTIARPLGAVYVGVNKAVGKHHWEVFQDEGRDSRVDELITSTLRSQTEAAADFDIEWGQDPTHHPFMLKQLQEFRQWLIENRFDPDDPALTIGHPQVGQVDLVRSFGTADYRDIWHQLQHRLDVVAIQTSGHRAEYDYCWSDPDYINHMTGVSR